MKELFGGLLILAAIVGTIYGGYWVCKNVSYKIFYEDMVVETIHETVKPEFLR